VGGGGFYFATYKGRLTTTATSSVYAPPERGGRGLPIPASRFPRRPGPLAGGEGGGPSSVADEP